MEVFDFFEPVDIDKIKGSAGFEEASWHQAIDIYKGKALNLSGRKIVLIGIEEAGKKESPSYEVRKYLYRLGRPEYAEQVADLGDFKFTYETKAFETLGFVLS